MCIIVRNAYFTPYACFLVVKCQSLWEVLQQQSDKFGVQLHTGKIGQVSAGTAYAPRPLIGAGREQGIKDIGDCNQFRVGMDLISAQAQVTAAIQALMVLERHDGSSAHSFVGMDQDTGADFGMHTHKRSFLLCQRTGLAEDGNWDGRLTDIMDKGGLGNRPHLGVWKVGQFGQQFGKCCRSAAVSLLLGRQRCGKIHITALLT